MFWRPQGILGASERVCPGSCSPLLAAAPLTGMGNYPLHLMIMCLLWAFVYTGWAMMGRLGMVSLGHGAFLGIGAYGGGDGVEPLGPFALAGTAARAGARRTGRVPDRLSVLPLQDRRPLLRAGDARALGNRAHDHRRAARPDRWLAWRHAATPRCRAPTGRSSRCSSPRRWCGSTSCWASGWRACGSGPASTARWRASRWRRSARKRMPPRRSA